MQHCVAKKSILKFKAVYKVKRIKVKHWIYFKIE